MVPKEQSVAPGTDAEFQVKATGDGLHFQWKKDYKKLHDGIKYYGTKTDTLGIKDVEKTDKGHYQCLVKNDNGEKPSNKAKSTVGEAKLTVSKLVLKTLIYSFRPNITLSFHICIVDIRTFHC